MLIDVHTHVVPNDVRVPYGGSADNRWPHVRVDGNHAEVWVGGNLFRRIDHRCWSPAARVDAMDSRGIEIEVVSPMPELMCYWAPAADADVYCRWMNGWITEFVAQRPTRFRGLGIVPLQDLERSIDLLPEIATLGLSGIMVGSNVNGKSVGHDQFLPLFAAAEAHSLAVFVHAFKPPENGLFPPVVTGAMWFGAEIAATTLALIGRNLDVRYPSLRMAVSHAAGGALADVTRLQYFWEHLSSVRDVIEHAPIESARHLFYDATIFDPVLLRYVIDQAGEQQVLLGSDYPFIEWKTDTLLESLGSNASERDLLRRTNAIRWLGE